MAITEETRHRLYQRLEGFLGPEEATILMEHLPPVGWADVATKRDLDQFAAITKRDVDHLGTELRLEMGNLGAGLRLEMAAFRADIQRDMRLQAFTLIGAFTAINSVLVGLVVGLVR